jgi:hypothetical protein
VRLITTEGVRRCLKDMYRRELKRVRLPTIWKIPEKMWQIIRPLLPPQNGFSRLLGAGFVAERRATQGQRALEAQEARHPGLQQAAGLRGLEIYAEINSASCS